MSVVSVHPRRTHRGVVPVVTGTALAVVGGLVAASAIGLIAVFGRDGVLDSGAHQVSTSGSALVTDVAHIQNTRGVGALTGWPTIAITASGGDAAGVFIGIGPADQVERYLAGTAYDQVSDLDLSPFELAVQRHPGLDEVAVPAPPTAQSFWVAAADSRAAAELSWRVRNGDYRLVVMNADGSPNLIAQARIQLTLPNAFAISMIVLGSGALLVLIGAVVVVVGLSRGGGRPDFADFDRRSDVRRLS